MTKSKRNEIARKLRALQSLDEGELQQASGGGGATPLQLTVTTTLRQPSINWVAMNATCGSYNL